MECLRYVVGITESECPCYDEVVEVGEGEDATPEVDTGLSHSGYFIDDRDDGISLVFPQNAKDCGDENLFTVIDQLREEANRDFITDFGAHLHQFARMRHVEVIATVSKFARRSNRPLPSSTSISDNVGVKIYPLNIRGGTFTINRIQVITDGNLVDSNLIIRHSVDDFASAVHSIQFSASADVLTDIVLTAPITLPITDAYGRTIEYTVSYDRQGAMPYNTQIRCGTCGHKKRNMWQNYAEIEGIHFANPDEIGELENSLNRSHGLLIDTRWQCNSMTWVCPAHTEAWQSVPYFRVIAKVLQLMAVNKVIGYLVNSPKITRYTTVKSDYLQGKRNHNRKEIHQRFAWLSQNLPPDLTDCFACAQSRVMMKAEILV